MLFSEFIQLYNQRIVSVIPGTIILNHPDESIIAEQYIGINYDVASVYKLGSGKVIAVIDNTTENHPLKTGYIILVKDGVIS